MRVSLLAALVGSLLTPFARGRATVVLEHNQTLPDGWRIEAGAPLQETLSVSIALAQPKLGELEAYMLQQIGRPTSSSTHLSLAQLATYQAPHKYAVDHVLGWLADSGVNDTIVEGAWVRFNATVDIIQALFEANISYYTYRNSTTPVLRAQSYSIPKSLADYVDFVFPLAQFMPPADARRLPKTRLAQDARPGKRLTRMERRQTKGSGSGAGGGPGNNGGSGPGGAPGGGNAGGPWGGRGNPGWDGPGPGLGHWNGTYPLWSPFMACIPNLVTPACIRQMYNWSLPGHPGPTKFNFTIPPAPWIIPTTRSIPAPTGRFVRAARTAASGVSPDSETTTSALNIGVSLEPGKPVPFDPFQLSSKTVTSAFIQSSSPTKPPTTISSTSTPSTSTPSTLSTPSTPDGRSLVRFGIAGFLSEYVNHQDVAEFLQFSAPSIGFPGPGNPVYNFTTVNVNNGANIQMPRFLAGMEASLDVEYAMALGYPSQIIFYSTGGVADKINPAGSRRDPRHSNNEPYLDLLEFLIAQPADTIPHVLSISYSDDEQTVPQPYATRVCQLFMQLAARGTTVLVATGDGGSHGISDSCIHGDGSNKHPLQPTFPASCPWVTAVGSTEIGIWGPGAVPPAIGAEYSSGGFSNYFPRPAWQNDTVNTYLGRFGDSKAGLFNRYGRGVPDISVIGSNFAVTWGGVPSMATGTSASTPVVAAMVALANDRRLKAGKSPLGWLNGALYSPRVQSILEDVTFGISKGCMPFNRTVWPTGWPAATGWDAVTGLGVPNDFDKFSAALLEV
ncbi:tripeptidyl peptidase sed3 [Sporothrix schenckii 1099-18]|uniref:tripeptidyl-peptidase II n=1 Tax=Sporothrix schenckii 1099-18 TaxID=1397361 RepID=A0A0F2MFD6_SPOSC|nr:tripeptidyl peptidase sed3 [Sporothrix schenckii 1099-18]KJR88347.1 tripeptidyl peptidase sed3 [Sporothrix schenckii 1099-18]